MDYPAVRSRCRDGTTDCFAEASPHAHLRGTDPHDEALSRSVGLRDGQPLAGCSLYFGGSDNDGSWNYCGDDGYYECEGNDCFWRSPECPAGVGTNPNPGGTFECSDSTDCAAGCYCGPDGVCEEAGFCTQDSDCGEGYECNEDRASCEPGRYAELRADGDCPAG